MEAEEAAACKGSCKLADAPAPLKVFPPLMPFRKPLPFEVPLPPLTRLWTSLLLLLPLLFPFAERRETRDLVPAILKTVCMSRVHADTMLIGARTVYLNVLLRGAPLPLGDGYGRLAL